ncbi:GIY-YIG nuclease family protein [Neptuniibacter sp. QD29_5]|uniref:GIY-YIG nuclease family protein n=1 Tax=Neptuniibacter sp. QD29_5 TaxID=3398207 RepID=UPI0039F621E5
MSERNFLEDKAGNWYVYILRCADETLYTGITTDLERRIRQHNGEIVGGAKYTRVRRPVSLFWQEEHLDRSSASKREYEIKRLSRQKKENLVES